jgi:hypothetical protein
MIMRVAVVPTANAMLAGTIQSRGFVRMRVISRSRVESGIKEDNSSVQPTTDHPFNNLFSHHIRCHYRYQELRNWPHRRHHPLQLAFAYQFLSVSPSLENSKRTVYPMDIVFEVISLKYYLRIPSFPTTHAS